MNSWEKTHGMRVGSLRGSSYLPEGWVEGRDINTADSTVRYLGIFLGAPTEVARTWEKKVIKKIEARFDRWYARGVFSASV